jgi:hypothetical protein
VHLNVSDYLYPVIWLVGVVFGAGSAWALFVRTRKDVNALGRVVRRDRWNHMLAEMAATDSREDRRLLADMMREQ